MIRYEFSQKQINYIPGNIVAYWLSNRICDVLATSLKLKDYGIARQGLATSDNNIFLKLWYEVKLENISFTTSNCNETKQIDKKWFPYSKGGSFRRWSSINEYVVNYQNDGEEIKKSVMKKYPYLSNPGFVVKNTETYFKQGITWNDVSTYKMCARFVPNGFIYDAAGPMFFSDNIQQFLGYFNSNSFQLFASIICQGLHYSTGHIPEIPYIDSTKTSWKEDIENLSSNSLDESKKDWDSFETSWDFKKHPLI